MGKKCQSYKLQGIKLHEIPEGFLRKPRKKDYPVFPNCKYIQVNFSLLDLQNIQGQLQLVQSSK